ncbi:MAG: transferrin receptor-like dimerization domain-containing protein [Candidatus Palauibacterales bacterium]|nr:transferrin receptor-like dimerization domain-containing protein [Candidatus Palauibacterales bacterium]
MRLAAIPALPALILPLMLLAPSGTGASRGPRPASAASDTSALLGFSSEAAARQRTLETRFDSLLDPAQLRAWLKRMSSEPNQLGSPHGKVNAMFVDSLFRAWGFQTRIDEYQVLFPTPKQRVLEMVAPTRFQASLREPPVKGDATSSVYAHRLPPYNAYSADGDVTSELVYVNQGIPRDYEALARMGIDVKGKIVIARYGGSWRGIKPKVAAEHGAIGCILYSDPLDDGYHEGETWPDGPFRPPEGVQRGSVMDMPLYPGDPLTPGVGATADAKRLSPEEAPTIMKIPVLPVSYADAKPLLAALAGPVAPEGWRGGLPITYHVGPGPAKVHLKLAFDWKLATAYDVVGMLPGSERPDEWVLRGNHRDGWVFGAEDPLSGQVALLEEAKAVGALARTGWRPRRTIVYLSWDGEEPALLGSTEWAEDHAAELEKKAVLYINSDSNGRGFLGVGGSGTLVRFVNQVAREVTDPETGVSVAARALARRDVEGRGDDEASGSGGESERLPLSPLGSGSDYSPFLQHLGIASLNLGYGGESRGGIYHSAYDSFDWYLRYGDPSFAYGVTLARTAGRLTLRMADAQVLPLSLTPFAKDVARYADQVMALADSTRKATARRNERVASDAYRLAHDPSETYVAPDSQAGVPYLDFSPLQNAVAALNQSAAAYDRALAAASRDGGAPSEAVRARLNTILGGLEQSMTRKDGLPRRPWFRHQIYAPGFYTGYGVKTLPGVREAIEQRSWDEATEQIRILAGTLRQVAAGMDRAREALSAS